MNKADALVKELNACQDRKREGDLLFGNCNFEAAEQVYRDAAAPLLVYTTEDGAGNGRVLAQILINLAQQLPVRRSSLTIFLYSRWRGLGTESCGHADDTLAESCCVLPQATSLCRRCRALHRR